MEEIKEHRAELVTSTSSRILNQRISFISDTETAIEHCHHCYEVIVGLNNNLSCTIDGQTINGLRGIIVNQTIVRSWSTQGSSVLVNLVEPDSSWGRQLRAILAGKPWLNIDSILDPEQFSLILPNNHKKLPDKVLIHYLNALMDSIFSFAPPTSIQVADKRIRIAIEFINQNLNKPLELRDIAMQIELSQERTRHLFIEQTGIPFSQYVLWKRLQQTIMLTITEEIPLSKTCLRFGFTDQPHFNRTFKRMFGLTPKNIIRHGRVLL